MRHLCFAASVGAVLAAPSRGAAQGVPGRDLLDFTIGALGEAPAVAVEAAGGLYNPAAPLLAASGRVRGSVSHVNAPGERGLSGQVAGLEWRVRPRTAVSASVARAGVGDIPRTGSSPDIEPGLAVTYDTYVASAGVAQRVQRHVAVGGALRYRVGRLDTASASTVGVDAGVVADGLLGARDLRLGLSTFLWRPNATREDRPSTAAAADVRLVGRAPGKEVRVGASYLGSSGGEGERYGYLTGRLRNVEGRVGVARASGLGGTGETRLRLGFGLRYARLLVAIAREEGASALGPVYQFTLSTIIK